MVRAYFTLLIGAGEVAALIGLYRNEANALTNGLVWLGLGSALVALVSSVLGHQWGYWRRWWATNARADWWLQALMLAISVVLTFWFLGLFA